MHDTHMIEKLYQSIIEICDENSIEKVNEMTIEVDEGSHIESQHLLSHLIDRDNILFGNFTKLHIEKKPFDRLTAIIQSIDGDSRE